MSNMLVVAVNGPSRAGKNTAVGFLIKQLGERGIAAREYSMIEPVRKKLVEHFDVTFTEPYEPNQRDLLANVGNALEIFNGFKTKHAINRMKEYRLYAAKYETKGLVAFIYVREQDVVNRLRDELSALGIPLTVLMVERRGVQPLHSNPADRNVREMGFDIMVANHGTRGDLFDVCERIAMTLASMVDNPHPSEGDGDGRGEN